MWIKCAFLPLAALALMTSGCSDYRSFERSGRSWEAARAAAQDDPAGTHALKAMASGTRHVVMPGDTLTRIAQTHDVPFDRLAALNGLSPPYPIYVGQVLHLVPAPPPPAEHAVRPGETVMAIGRRYDMTLAEIVRLNPDLQPDRIRVGQRLRLAPGEAPAATRVAEPRPVRADTVVADAAPPRVEALRRPVSTGADRPTLERQRAAATGPVPALSGSGFIWPIEGPLLSGFGVRDNGTRSDGIDIAAPLGSIVQAAENGVVVYAGEDIPAMGRMLMIRHAGGYLSAYAHAQTLLVVVGDRVSRGQPVAKVGATGRVARPLLHFELRQGKRPLDPVAHLPRLERRVASSD
ncbi:MAG: M23 family metallopeptidase [Geminicoccaceae bacterium]|nr:M23 family metallopeptidase [Geminicoccaceae bacterium]